LIPVFYKAADKPGADHFYPSFGAGKMIPHAGLIVLDQPDSDFIPTIRDSTPRNYHRRGGLENIVDKMHLGE